MSETDPGGEAAPSVWEERYRTLFEAIDSGFCIIEMIFGEDGRATDYRFVEVNPAFERQSGLVDAVGRRIREFAPDLEDHWFERYGRVALTGEPMRVEGEAAPLGRWFDINAFRVGAAEQRRIAVLFNDITERRNTEAALRDSEHRFRLIVESASDYAIFTTDAKARVDQWYAGAEAVFGYSAVEIRGQDAAILFTPEDRAKGDVERELSTAREEGSAANIRWHLRKGGERVFVEGRTIALHDGGGEVSGYLKIGQNLTERHRRDAALEISEGRLADIFANASVGLSEIDRDGRFLRVNDELCRILGRSREELLSSTIADVSHPDDLPSSLAVVAETVRTGRMGAVEKRYRRPDGETVWANSTVTMLRDAQGGAGALLVVTVDLTQRHRAEAALRESEIRFQEFGDNSGNALWIVDAVTQRLEYLSPAFERIWGEPREGVMTDMTRWAALVHPDDRARALEGMPRLLAGERFDAEYRIVRPDGAVRWIHDAGFPIFDEDGRVSRVAGIAQDFTEERKAADAVRESELRFRTLSEGIPQLVWRAVDHGVWTWASPQWTGFTGQPNEESHGWGWLDPVHPGDRDAARAAWERAKETDTFEVEYRIRHAATGDYRWFTTRATPVLDERGGIIEWLGTSTDIDELRSLQRHQATLLAELQHRVRNTLAVLRSIARRTAENSDSVDEMSAHLQGRIGAFSRVQSAITRAPGKGVELGSLIAEEMTAHLIDEGERLSIKGPPVELATRPAETLSLALHELATNAVKYGALASARGLIRIEWSRVERDGEPWLRFRWTERALDTPLAPPERRGFGLELFERTLAYDLGAEVRVDFPPDGAEFEAAMPLRRVGAG